ncbi:transposon Ty3-I Gag-Pol polyprotein [Trichonephila clavipes]|uniref:Transposon Ty3-I Gag-Pol polyprotein n=1 Tax=Trichonephila clavipes TaxID=2585209 RepID=A0A8X7BMB1_TRICX|nr:transposon Ty3-I Gag-Pol polyprotein [Trichonephila clavipes]
MFETEPTLNEMFEKVSALSDCPSVSLEELVEIDDDNVCTAPIMADKDILEFVQNSKNIIDADSDDENKMNNAALVPTSSAMRNIIKSERPTSFPKKIQPSLTRDSNPNPLGFKPSHSYHTGWVTWKNIRLSKYLKPSWQSVGLNWRSRMGLYSSEKSRSLEKLLRRYFGPYQVLRRLSAVTYEVQDFDPASRKRKLREVVHVLRMKPYHDPAEQIETEDIPPKESYKGPITRSRIKTLEQNDSGALSSFLRGAMPHA